MVEIFKNNKLVFIYSVCLSLVLIVSNICIAYFAPAINFDLDFFVYLILTVIPLIIIGCLAFKKLKNRQVKIIFYSVIILIYLFIIVHAQVTSGDYQAFLSQWYNFYKNNTLKVSLYKIIDVSNYTPFYNYFLIVFAKLNLNPLYSIKYLTYLFSLLLAFIIEKIISNIRKEDFNYLRFILVLIIPSVLIEYSAWGQCDAIYTSFALISLYFALNKKSKLSFMFIGLSFATKLQFLFIVPILFVMLIVKDESGEHYLKWKDIWIAPLMYAVNLIPVFAGRSVIDLLSVYISQSVFDYRISGDCANFCLSYMILSFEIATGVSSLYNVLIYVHVIVTFLLMLFILYFTLRYNKIKTLSKVDLIFIGTLFSFVMVFFMPKMLDRFYFISLCLSYILMWCKPSKINFIIFTLISNSIYFMMYLHISACFSTTLSVVLTTAIALISAAINLSLLFYVFYKDYIKTTITKKQNKVVYE